MSNNGWIGVDFDGTLAHYDGWKGETTFGRPVPAMLDRVKRWVGDGHEVRVFTARVSDEDGRPEIVAAIQAWLVTHGLPALAVTNVKDFQMIELWDDRAVQVIPNTGEPVGRLTP